MLFDWHQFHASEAVAPAVVDSRRRLRICLAGFVVSLLVVFGRAVQLEVTQGAAFRGEAAKPLRRETQLPGVRGRILAGDGTVLAYDRQVPAVAVHYRHLESELSQRLARLCDVSPTEWRRRARRIESRVEQIAQSVRRRRGTETTVAEQLDYHVMAEDVPLEVVAEIEAHPEQYPGVKIVKRSRRAYPAGPLAAHVLGHLGPVTQRELEQEDGEGPGYHPADFVGRTGLERQYESLLRGRRGLAVELTDHSGRVLSCFRARQPGVGRDLVLTLDPSLQRAAEALLDSALKRRTTLTDSIEPAGGAIVVMDVGNGAIRAAAAAPRFDPNLFISGNSARRAALLTDPARPLFDRASQMAIPPGSLLKTLSAVALLESATVDPDEAFFCQGYLHRPDRQRCAIYQRQGTGHGEVALGDALAVSCNVYFFHHAGRLGVAPLVDWARRFGFGQPTGVDLPGEAAGSLPAPQADDDSTAPARQTGLAQLLAVGQGPVTVTPLQIVRMMGAVANGGRLVTPHLVARLGLPELTGDETPEDYSDDPIRVPPPRPIPGLRPQTLEVVREGLRRVVSDAEGTAHGTVCIDSIAIAGKTGTAETGGGRAAHAWFAGYLPAERPKLALVVVLEHSGDATAAAGPVAKRLVLRMIQLGIVVGRSQAAGEPAG